MIFFTFVSIILLLGFSTASPDIPGGIEVDDGDLPYQALLRFQISNNPEDIYICTGTLIKPDTILTSAKCGVKFRIGYAVLGVSNIRGISSSQTADVVVVRHVLVHENYNATSLEHNIALVHLNRPARLKEGVIETVALLENISEDGFIGRDVSVSGWGPEQHYLKRADVIVMSNLSCRIRYENLLWSQICAGRVDTAGPCQYDEGAPMIALDGEGREVQMGVFSYSKECKNGTPGVYTRISPYLAWIENNL